MGVAITLCDKTEHERRQKKHDDSLFSSSEAESLPRLIQFSPVPLHFSVCSFWHETGRGIVEGARDFKAW
jgi:hypothetical protein